MERQFAAGQLAGVPDVSQGLLHLLVFAPAFYQALGNTKLVADAGDNEIDQINEFGSFVASRFLIGQ